MDSDRLAELDADGYTALLAIAYGRGPKHGSFAYPHAFVCEDGETYLAEVDAGLRCECPEPDLAGCGYRDHAPTAATATARRERRLRAAIRRCNTALRQTSVA